MPRWARGRPDPSGSGQLAGGALAALARSPSRAAGLDVESRHQERPLHALELVDELLDLEIAARDLQRERQHVQGGRRRQGPRSLGLGPQSCRLSCRTCSGVPCAGGSGTGTGATARGRHWRAWLHRHHLDTDLLARSRQARGSRWAAPGCPGSACRGPPAGPSAWAGRATAPSARSAAARARRCSPAGFVAWALIAEGRPHRSAWATPARTSSLRGCR